MATLQTSQTRTMAGNIRLCEECGGNLGKVGGMRIDGELKSFHAKCPPKVKGHKKHGGWGNGSMNHFYKKAKNPEILPYYKMRTSSLLQTI